MEKSSQHSDWNAVRSSLARRIREIREELYGEHGGPLLAEALNLGGSAIERALRASRSSGQPLAVALSLLGLATEDAIAEACSRLSGAPRAPVFGAPAASFDRCPSPPRCDGSAPES